MDLILASTSPYRRTLLQRLGVPFRVVDPALDEEPFKAKGLAPRELAEALALAKAERVAQQHPLAIVIGSDQVAQLDNTTLGKPGTIDGAIAQLSSMAGREHQLITAVAVTRSSGAITHTDVTILAMRHLAADAIRRYVEADMPLDCAGSYKLESRGITLFHRIDSADHTAIVGLPLIAVTSILRTLGVILP